MVTYRVIEESIYSGELGWYTAYGISAYYASTGEEIAHITDVFLNKADADSLVDQCNRLGLEPVHLPIIIEDALIKQRKL